MATKSLGLFPIPERTIEHDLTLLERYQEFSAELLRVALIGISAIGFVLSRVLFPEKGAEPAALTAGVKPLIIAALVALAVSAAAALVHRYCAADSMSWHLQAMRRCERASGSDATQAIEEFRTRYAQFKRSRTAIAASAVALGSGAAFLVAAIIHAIP